MLLLIRELYAGKKIIVGRDRLDSVRGVAQKLQAYEIFLERHPEWHDKVVLIQVTSPTSVEDKEEGTDRTANKISDLVARINGTYGSLSFTPVQHYPQYLSREEYFALLRIADVGLITSVRDGMNTTALEYVICHHLGILGNCWQLRQCYTHQPLGPWRHSRRDSSRLGHGPQAKVRDAQEVVQKCHNQHCADMDEQLRQASAHQPHLVQPSDCHTCLG